MFYLATYRWQDGEQQYFTRRFIKTADSQLKADEMATGYLTDMWGDQTINEDGDFQPPWGYPIVRVDSCVPVMTLQDVVKVIGCIDEAEIYISQN